MSNWKATVPVLLALIIAFSGSYFLYQWVKRETAPAASETVKAATEAVPVVVAAADLTWGTKLLPEMLKTVPYLKGSLPPGCFSDVNALANRVTLAVLKKDQPIFEHQLAPDSVTSGGVSAVVQPGKRAIAVKGDKVIGISGFINPNNRVDVLVTMQDPTTKKDTTKLVLEHILVLATGTQIQKNEKGEPAPVDVYTLEVTPEEAEKLALAASQGRLQFALRNSTDSESVRTKGATIHDTLSSLKLIQQAPPPKSESGTKSTIKWRPRPVTDVTVEIIKGNEVSKKKLNP